MSDTGDTAGAVGTTDTAGTADTADAADDSAASASPATTDDATSQLLDSPGDIFFGLASLDHGGEQFLVGR